MLQSLAILIDENDEFFTDFSGSRKGFNEKKIFKMLNINPNTRVCNPLASPARIFLSDYRGLGKTTELLKLCNELNKNSITHGGALVALLVKKVVLEYGDGSEEKINPIISKNETYKKIIKWRVGFLWT